MHAGRTFLFPVQELCLRVQVEAAERQWETGQRVRRLKAAELRSQLAALEEQHMRAAELLRASKATCSQLEEEYRQKTMC